MTLKSYKPYTKSTRTTILVDRKGIWRGRPVKSLTIGKKSTGGRNNLGRITSRSRGSGHKKRYEYGELSLIFQNLGLLESKESAFMSLLFPFIKYHRKKAIKVTQEINDFEILRENARLPSKIQNLFFQIILSFERLFLFP